MNNDNNLAGVNPMPSETPSTAPAVGDNAVSITTPEAATTPEVSATPAVDSKPAVEAMPEAASVAPATDEAFSEPIANTNPIISSANETASPAPEAAPAVSSAPDAAQATNSAPETPVFGNQVSNPTAPAAPAVPVAGKSSHAGLIICIIMAIVVVGLGILVVVLKPWESLIPKTDSNKSGDNGGAAVVTPTNSDGKCEFYECLSKVNIDNTPEEVEEIFGFAPEVKTESKIDYYTWTFDEDHTIEMAVSTLYNGTKSTLHIQLKNFPDSDVEQKGVTFDNVQSIKSNMNVGDGVSYDEFKDYMGGVDGILIDVSSSSKKYVWRSTDSKGYINGSFNEDGRCNFMSGITY